MQKLLRNVRGFFVSPKTAISLLAIIALASIVGTLVPQKREIGQYIEHYGASLYGILGFFGFFDLFNSWWFQLLLLLLIVNLVVCSLKRVSRSWVRKGLTLKERIGGLGPHITHLSVIVILAGSVIGNVSGFKGHVNIIEGTTINGVMLQGSNQGVKLDFAVRCDRFEMSTYPGTNLPKDYISDLTVLEGGKEVLRKTIRVNDPLRYKGISFYQSSYGVAPGGRNDAKVEIEVGREGKDAPSSRMQIAPGERHEIPGTKQTIQVAAFLPDFVLGEGNRPMSRSDEPNNPAIRVDIYERDRLLFSGWSFLNFPDFHGAKDSSFSVKFLNYSNVGGQRKYTGLQVVKDPGVGVVWAGFIMLVLGLIASFFFRPAPYPKRRLEKKGGSNA